MNIYYDTSDRPNDADLIRIGTLEADDDDCDGYGYKTLLVIQHVATGRVFYAAESGDSCPVPFDSVNWAGPDDNQLTEIRGRDAWSGFQREVDSFPVSQEERAELLTNAKAALVSRILNNIAVGLFGGEEPR